MLSISNFLSDFFKEFQSSTVSDDKSKIDQEKINKLINQITGEGTPNKKIVSIRVVGGLKKESDNKEILIDYSANKKNNKSTYIRQFYSPNEI
jgi:hypothetical protein